MTLNPVQEPSRSSRSKRRKKEKERVPSADSDDDDLIVVKTEHNTIDPITKKQIVEPVRNKKCNHIYEKSTIYSMIELARENSKPVKCPYMGCNCRDFKKTDLVKDKDVLSAINTLKDEKEKAEQEKQKKETERKQKKMDNGYASDNSIIEDIDDDDDDEGANKFDVPEIEAPNLSESSSEETSVPSPQKAINQSSSSVSLNSSANVGPVAEGGDCEKSKETSSNKNKTSKKAKKKRTERLSYSDVSDSSDSDSGSSDVPLSRARKKRSRKPSSRLADSYACSDLDDSDQSDGGEVRRRGKKKGKSPKGKKIKVVAKKVTETWSIEKAATKSKKRRRRRNDEEDDEDEDFDNSDEEKDNEETSATTSKGKASKGKPPKNAQFSRSRPKRAKQVSYKEYDENF